MEGALRAEGVDPSKSALVILRLEDGRVWSSGGARIHERFTPASTARSLARSSRRPASSM
jgi:hypothetical protein